MGKYIPQPLKYPIIATYIFIRCVLRGLPAREIKLNLSGVLPKEGSNKIVHGGKVKLLTLREKFGNTWRHFNIAYFASSGLPFAPAIWIKIYKLFGVKIVWNQNGVAYPALYNQVVLDRINNILLPIHLCNYVVYQTKFTKHCSDKFLGKFSGPSEIIINPVDIDKFKPNESLLPQTPFTIIMSGHHFESKVRMAVTIDALRKFKEEVPDTRLIIIGNTQETPNENWIEIIGKFTQEEAPDLYRKAHIFLHLKYLDPCPTLVLEALASGLPVVGQANGGMPELVNSQSGVLLPVEEDFEKLHYPKATEVSQALMAIKNNLGEYSRQARIQALNFDKKIWLKKHEEIFQKLCQ